MTFKQAVDAAPGLAGAWRAGLQALEKRDTRHVAAQDTRRLRGSIHVDAVLKPRFPNDQRWDYGIGHQPTNRNDEVAYWIEVHPASDGEVKVVLAKLEWLKAWLANDAPDLNRMRKEFIWVSSGQTFFTPASTQQKRFALLGLQHIGRRFRIPDEAVA